MPDTKARRKDEAVTKGMESVTAEAIRDRLGEYLGQVEYGRKSFIITRHGEPAALLVPIIADAG